MHGVKFLYVKDSPRTEGQKSGSLSRDRPAGRKVANQRFVEKLPSIGEIAQLRWPDKTGKPMITRQRLEPLTSLLLGARETLEKRPEYRWNFPGYASKAA